MHKVCLHRVNFSESIRSQNSPSPHSLSKLINNSSISKSNFPSSKNDAINYLNKNYESKEEIENEDKGPSEFSLDQRQPGFIPPLNKIKFERGKFLESLDRISEIQNVFNRKKSKEQQRREALRSRELSPVLHPELLLEEYDRRNPDTVSRFSRTSSRNKESKLNSRRRLKKEEELINYVSGRSISGLIKNEFSNYKSKGVKTTNKDLLDLEI